MKKVLLIILSLVFIISVGGCSGIAEYLKLDTKTQVAEETTETTNSGFTIKVKQKNTGQNDMLEALTLLENIYGQPVVVTNANVIGDGKASIRYTLYFDVNNQLYTVCTIINGRIMSIDTINKSSVVLEPIRIPIHKIVPVKPDE